MNRVGERLYTNKYTDVKKLIGNHVLPKFQNILKRLTGKDGKKSGYFSCLSSCCVCNTFHRYNDSPQTTLEKANKILHKVSILFCKYA